MSQAAALPGVASPVGDPGPRDPRPALLVHGHFYQPAREDPFTGVVPLDPSAAPAHDWNERVVEEAYAPNAAVGNLARMGGTSDLPSLAGSGSIDRSSTTR